MTDEIALYPKLTKIFSEKLNLEVPSVDIDLVEEGVLDSLALVELIVCLEQEFGMNVLADEIEIDNFRSIAKIAEFVAGVDRLKKIA